MKPYLEVRIGKLKLKNPVMVASGTFGPEYGELVDIGALGAYVAKTITLEPRTGNPPPRIVETPSGMLNSIGLENKGVDDFIRKRLPLVAGFGIPVIVSIAGNDAAEYALLARKLEGARRIDGIEINLSCPNVRHGKHAGLIAQDAAATSAVVRAVRKMTKRAVIAKLSPAVTDIAPIARAAEEAGADAVLIANTFPGLAIDSATRRPILGNTTGGLSGPAIRPLALKLVWDAYKAISIPIIGCGGIVNFRDALEYILCGATAVQIGTASFVNPSAALDIIEGIKKYLVKEKIRNILDLVGALKTG